MNYTPSEIIIGFRYYSNKTKKTYVVTSKTWETRNNMKHAFNPEWSSVVVYYESNKGEKGTTYIDGLVEFLNAGTVIEITPENTTYMLKYRVGGKTTIANYKVMDTAIESCALCLNSLPTIPASAVKVSLVDNWGNLIVSHEIKIK